jgi:hypothetical protein
MCYTRSYEEYDVKESSENIERMGDPYGQDRPHNSKLSQERIKASKAERLSHPVYNPVIVQTDFLLLESLKEKCMTTIARASQTS